MREKIKNLIKDAFKNLNIENAGFEVEHPEDLKNGDYSTNVAMVCAKKLKADPKELAEKIREIIQKTVQPGFSEIEEVRVAGSGFINFYLSRKFFANSIEEILNRGEGFGKNDILSGKKIMVEYTDPNPFKPFHIGHLMSNAIGESISRLAQFSGAEVARANYQGDVGLHAAKAIYGLLENEKLQSKEGLHNLQAENIGRAYSRGAELYETDEKAKK